ncbi:MAG: hypothetical protein QF921_02635 [Pseudomonadales bacterium]|jgi:hypothetical protein|nr:hypothetical protein [Pseudomonadales bacterium]MDP6472504.1 hypothetical protein [Pseudomonadales bacterium]MDP6828685.1 hypothetical protein [Pseudomonadales bacterium]MDP6970405.1 hypothetical protein [Pseudomonadales bacterium]
MTQYDPVVRAGHVIDGSGGEGSWLERKAQAYLATTVSGEGACRDGEAPDALPGRLIR